MNKYDGCILDTSVLISLYTLDLVDKLYLLFNEVRIPVAVEREFLNRVDEERDTRFKFINEMYDKNQIWFKKCNEYGSDLVEIFLSSKLDEGEAEVLAQNQALQGSYITLIDERRARNVAKHKSNFRVHGTLYILANLDIKLQACDYYKCVEYLRKKIKMRFKDKLVDEVYKSVREGL